MDGRRREREREPGRGNFVISPANITPSLPSFLLLRHRLFFCSRCRRARVWQRPNIKIGSTEERGKKERGKAIARKDGGGKKERGREWDGCAYLLRERQGYGEMGRGRKGGREGGREPPADRPRGQESGRKVLNVSTGLSIKFQFCNTHRTPICLITKPELPIPVNWVFMQCKPAV